MKNTENNIKQKKKEKKIQNKTHEEDTLYETSSTVTNQMGLTRFGQRLQLDQI